MSRRYFFAVSGKGNFPFIMLNRSKCWPATPQEAFKIHVSTPTVAPPQEVVLCTDTPLEGSQIQEWAKNQWPIKPSSYSSSEV